MCLLVVDSLEAADAVCMHTMACVTVTAGMRVIYFVVAASRLGLQVHVRT